MQGPIIKGDNRSHCRDRGKVLQHDGVSAPNTGLESRVASDSLYDYLSTSTAFNTYFSLICFNDLAPVWREGPH